MGKDLLWSWTCLGIFSLFFFVEAPGFGLTENYIPEDAIKVHGTTVLTLFNIPITRNEAVEACKEIVGQGGTIANPKSLEATNIIRDLLKGSECGAWIGLYWGAAEDSRKLKWSDMSCSEFDTRDFGQFTPSNDVDTGFNNCYYTDSSTGQWLKDSCNSKRFFICEHQDFTNTSCTSDKQYSGFVKIRASLYSVEKTGTNVNSCDSDCLKTTGCFLTWYKTRTCVMGVVEQKGGMHVRSRCFVGSNGTSQIVLPITPDTLAEPNECQAVNTTGISTNTTQISGKLLTGDSCSNTDSYITTTITSTTTVTSSTTLEVTKTELTTTTISSTKTITSTTVRTSTTSLVTTRVTVQTVVVSECSLEPTMVTDTELSIQSDTHTPFPDMNRASLFDSGSLGDTTASSASEDNKGSFSVDSTCVNCNYEEDPAPSTTNVKTTITATTIADASVMNILHKPPAASQAVVARVTASQAVVARVTASQAVVARVTASQAVVARVTASQAVGARPDTEVKTTTLFIERLSTVTADCSETSAFNPTAVMSACAAVTHTVTPVSTMTSDALFAESVISTGAGTFSGSSHGTSFSTTVSHNLTTPSQNLDEVTSSIISELLLHESALSSSRRRKESAPDDRTSAKVSGFMACAFICCVVASVMLLDIPQLLRSVTYRFKMLK